MNSKALARVRPGASGFGLSTLTLMLILILAATPALAERCLPTPDDRPCPATSPFLLKGTDVRMVVTGPVARAIVTQTWHNPNQTPVDGLYIFPLPEDAAVSDMRLTIGERVITSEIKKRAEAREIYEKARAEGRIAGLLDQERPNIFAQRVANIMPGVEIKVVLSYDQPLVADGGRYEVVFPTVVGPRFIPAHQTDPGQIAPPVETSEAGTPQRLTFRMELDAGLPIYSVGSPSHPVRVERTGEQRATVVLVENSRLDRDLRVRWTIAGDQPELGLLAYRDPTKSAGYGTFTAIVAPPALPASEEITPREIVFVLDCSGSMHGVPLEAAKDVVRKTLRRLQPRDRFQIIRFSESASGLSPEPLANTPQNVARALSYLGSLRGGGGTMMIEGIRAALDGRADDGRMRIVAFLTDGYIGNEREIFAEVRRLLGDTRIFAFGIGSSVNRYLLEGLAEEGRGTAAFRSPRESADDLVDRFVRRIEAPVLTDIKVSFEDLDVSDIEPGRIPDLFAGQPLVLNGRYTKPGTGVMIVEGKVAGRPVTLRRVVTLFDDARDNEALGRLWARARIHRLEREQHGRPSPAVIERITRLGLTHRLMTAYTSLVAVDSLVSNTTGGSTGVSVPVELPQDVPLSALGSAQYAGVAAPPPGLMRKGRGGTAWRALAAQPPGSMAVDAASEELRKVEGEAPVRESGSRDSGTASRQQTSGGTSGVAATGEETSLSFVTLTLVAEDGTRLIVEADGEVWALRGGSRKLLTTLSVAEVGRLAALAAACPGAGSASGGGARLVVEDARGRRSWSLRSAPPAVIDLARALGRFR